MEHLPTELALRAALLAMLIFGFSPRLVLRILVRAWPRDDARRRELVAELGCVPYVERLLWVGELVEAALLDGLPARWRTYRECRGARRPRWRARMSVSSLLFRSLVMATLGVAGVTWVTFDRTVTLTIDGQTRKVRTFARTVEGVLDQMDMQVGVASVSPPLSTRLRDGLHITIRGGEGAARHDRRDPGLVVVAAVVTITCAVAARQEPARRNGPRERAGLKR